MVQFRKYPSDGEYIAILGDIKKPRPDGQIETLLLTDSAPTLGSASYLRWNTDPATPPKDHPLRRHVKSLA